MPYLFYSTQINWECNVHLPLSEPHRCRRWWGVCTFVLSLFHTSAPQLGSPSGNASSVFYIFSILCLCVQEFALYVLYLKITPNSINDFNKSWMYAFFPCVSTPANVSTCSVVGQPNKCVQFFALRWDSNGFLMKDSCKLQSLARDSVCLSQTRLLSFSSCIFFGIETVEFKNTTAENALSCVAWVPLPVQHQEKIPNLD